MKESVKFITNIRKEKKNKKRIKTLTCGRKLWILQFATAFFNNASGMFVLLLSDRIKLSRYDILPRIAKG